MYLTSDDIDCFVAQQIAQWPTASDNFAALSHIQTRNLDKEGLLRVQFNPARIRSSAAKVDAQSIAERPCFLCRANQPSTQGALELDDRYLIEINPYPIFKLHLTIPSRLHEPQRIDTRLEDMLRMAKMFDRYTLFYNGPRCGASAPDHAHFQMIGRGELPIEHEADTLRLSEEHYGVRCGDYHSFHRNGVIFKSDSTKALNDCFTRLYNHLGRTTPDTEPLLNLIGWYADGCWTLCVFPRTTHRPSCFYAEGPERMLISPASVDMGGVLIMPHQDDYKRITLDMAAQIFDEVCIDSNSLEQLLTQLTR